MANEEQQVDDGQVEDGQQEQQTEEQGFVPENVDINDSDQLANLTEEELDAVAEVAPSPEKANEKEPLGTEDTEGNTEGEPAPTEGDDQKFAGKYDSFDDLVQGVGEIAGKLGYSTKAFQRVIDAAIKADDSTSVEELYKGLESQLGDKGAVAQGAAKPGQEPAQADTSSTDTFNPSDPKVTVAVDQLTASQIAQSGLAGEFQKANLPLPKNMEEFDQLKVLNPYLAMEFKQLYSQMYQRNLGEAKGYFEAAKTVESSNAKVIDTDTQALTKIAEANGFKLTPEEIAEVKAAALAVPYNYDTKYGHKFLRANAVRDHFMATKMLDKLEEIKVAQQAAGRVQAVNDLNEAGRREIRSVGTSRLSTKTRAIQKMPDLSDPDVLAALPDEALRDPEGYFKNFSRR